MEEIWKDIDGYLGVYQISNMGRIKSVDRFTPGRSGCRIFHRGIIRSLHVGKSKYCVVNLYQDHKMKSFNLARLVATHFIPNPKNKEEVNHLNGIPSDNRACNLEWCTPSENRIYSYHVMGREPPMLGRSGINSPFIKPVCQYTLDGVLIRTYNSVKEASEFINIGCGSSAISAVCNKTKYRKTAGGYLWSFLNEK